VKDTQLNGYFIPKDAMLLISVWTVLQDKSIWGDPKNFRPERFLDDEGNFRKDLASRVPIFGIGKLVATVKTIFFTNENIKLISFRIENFRKEDLPWRITGKKYFVPIFNHYGTKLQI